ncbi:hypothetical protein, partial [Nonomuraea guangzhouensis]
ARPLLVSEAEIARDGNVRRPSGHRLPADSDGTSSAVNVRRLSGHRLPADSDGTSSAVNVRRLSGYRLPADSGGISSACCTVPPRRLDRFGTQVAFGSLAWGYWKWQPSTS